MCAADPITWRAASPLLLVCVALTVLGDLSRWPWLTLLLLVLAFGGYWAAAVRLERSVSTAALMAVAAVLRLSLLPLPPALSDDLVRYLWDGRVVSAGLNPYRLAPESEELSELRDERWLNIPHKHVPTVYPPLALLTFSIATHFLWPEIGLKLVLALADLAGCFLLIRLAEALGLPPGRAIWYAWSPLVCLETAGMGHVDALGACAMIAASLLIVRKPQRPVEAALATGAAALVKIIPVIALPVWARHSGRPWRFAAVALVLLLATMMPVLVSTEGVPPGLIVYGISWEFNGPLFEPLWRLLDHAEVAAVAKSGLDVLKRLTGSHDFWNRFYPFVYSQLLAKLLLGGLFLAMWLRALGSRDLIVGSGRTFAAFLLCTATVYPWYLLWVLPWAALARHRAWLALQALIQLAYLPQLIGVSLFPGVFFVIWLPFFLLLGGSRWSTD